MNETTKARIARRRRENEAADRALHFALHVAGIKVDTNKRDHVMAALHEQGFDVKRVRSI
jgi:hypothetical protein